MGAVRREDPPLRTYSGSESPPAEVVLFCRRSVCKPLGLPLWWVRDDWELMRGTEKVLVGTRLIYAIVIFPGEKKNR